MLAKHPLNAVLWATLLLMGAVSSATGATSNSVSGEGQDVRMLNAFTTDSVIAGSTLTYSALAFVNALTLATTVIAPGDQHVSVPAMGEGGLILLSLLLGVCGMMAAARRQA